MSQRKAVRMIKARAYARGSRAEKTRILDELVERTGRNRDYARRALRQALELAPERAKIVLRGRSPTKPGSLLKSQIPVRTFEASSRGLRVH